jgi:hypothetical protein
MKRLILNLTIFLSTCLALFSVLSPGPVLAQGEVEVGDSVEIAFPLSVTFKLSVQSDTPVSDIRLQYTVAQKSFAQVISEARPDFSYDSGLAESDWTLDMKKIGGLPPGTRITYWWLIEDESGNTYQTTPRQFTYSDDRYSWRAITDGTITLHWYAGSDEFGMELMTAAQDALLRLAGAIGTYPTEPIDLYIYGSSQELQGAMLFPREWTGGVSYSNLSVIAIGINEPTISWGKSAIAHELAHLVLYQKTANPYNDIPLWFNEGMAMYTQGRVEDYYEDTLRQAVKEGSTISVQSLCSPFSVDPEKSYLSYAESYSLVKFLLTTYGQESVSYFLEVLSQGSTYDEALESAFGFNMGELNDIWLGYLENQYLPQQQSTPPWAIASMAVLSLALVGIIFVILRTRGKNRYE